MTAEEVVTVFLPTLTRRDAAELLDDPAKVPGDLAGNLADIRRLNRWFGGTRLALKFVLPQLSPRRATSILDVATGSADIPLALLDLGRRHRCEVEITAADISPEILEEARRYVGTADVRLVPADARRLPWPNRRFDVVLCSLALHHLDPTDASTALAEMWRVTNRRLIVLDLSRGYLAYAGTWLVTHSVARNQLTRHDGPLSVLRAYTAAELREFARRTGLGEAVRVTRHPFFRLALVADREVKNGR